MSRVAAAFAFFLALALPAAAAPATLRFATTFSEQGPSVYLAEWMKKVTADSGGRLQFQQFWDGQLVPNPAKEYDALVNGIDDATVVITPFVQAQFPDFALFSIPLVVNSAAEAAVGGWGLYKTGMMRGLDKMHVVAIYSNDVAGIHLAKRIDSLGQLKGLKIRVSGPAEGAIVRIMGGVPVGMGVADGAQALLLGTYDGTLNGWGASKAYRFTPVLKSHIEAPLGVRIFILALSRAAWDKLPPEAQAAIDKNGGAALSLALGKLSDADGAEERKTSIALHHTMVPLSDAERAALAASFHPLLTRWIAETPDGRKKYDTLEKILAQYRKGG